MRGFRCGTRLSPLVFFSLPFPPGGIPLLSLPNSFTDGFPRRLAFPMQAAIGNPQEVAEVELFSPEQMANVDRRLWVVFDAPSPPPSKELTAKLAERVRVAISASAYTRARSALVPVH